MKIQLEEIIINDEKDIGVVQVLRTGNFRYKGDVLKFTSNTLRTMKKNYDDDVRGVKLAIDYFHNSHDKAAGWVTGMETRNDDTELWLNVDWTEDARKQILAKELRYMSADIRTEYRNKESDKNFGPVLVGAGLTNRPHIDKMAAIFEEEEEEKELKITFNNNIKDNQMSLEFEEIIKAIVDLTDDQKAQLAEKLGSVKASEVEEQKALVLAEQEITKDLTAKVSELEVKLADTEKESKFAILLSEGKAVESQREAYMKGDMEGFVAASVDINLSEQGSGNTESKVDSKADAMVKLNEIAEADVAKTGIKFSEAFKKACKANEKLNTAINN